MILLGKESLTVEWREEKKDDFLLAIIKENPEYFVQGIKSLYDELNNRGLDFLSEYTKRKFLKLEQLVYQTKYITGDTNEDYN